MLWNKINANSYNVNLPNISQLEVFQVDEEIWQIDGKLKLEGHGRNVNINQSGWPKIHDVGWIVVSELWMRNQNVYLAVYSYIRIDDTKSEQIKHKWLYWQIPKKSTQTASVHTSFPSWQLV